MVTIAMLSTSCVNMKIGMDGDVVTEYRPLKDFEKIEISGSPNVYYVQADTFSVKVKGSKEGLENILTEVNDGTLSVRNRGKMGVVNIVIHDEDQAEVYVTSPDLVSVRLNGSGDFSSDQRVDTDQMEIALIGSGDIAIEQWRVISTRLHLKGSGDIKVGFNEGCQAVESELRGSGDITLKGVVSRFSQQITGSGDVDVDQLEIVK